MTPKEFQYGTVQKRLESLRRLLGELEKYQHVEADHLRANLSEMYAVFFMIQQIIARRFWISWIQIVGAVLKR